MRYAVGNSKANKKRKLWTSFLFLLAKRRKAVLFLQQDHAMVEF